jgi:hypothetical protein
MFRQYSLLIIGVICLLIGLYNTRKAFLAFKWLETQGVILKSEIETRRVGPNHSRRYHALIIYEYSVQGQTYQSNRLSFSDTFRKNPAESQSKIRLYPIGKRVTVFYNPKNPSEVILERSGNWFLRAEFFFGLIIILASLLKRIKKQPGFANKS